MTFPFPFRRKWRAVFRDSLTHEVTWTLRQDDSSPVLFRTEGDALVAATDMQTLLYESEYPSAVHEYERW